MWVAVEFQHPDYGLSETSEVVFAGYSEQMLKMYYGDVHWNKSGEQWAASLAENVGGIHQDSHRVLLVKTGLVDA